MTLKTTSNRSGQTLLMFTLALIPLMGMLGLVVDMGWAYFRQEAAQTAADAAANAAASSAMTAGGGSAPTCTTSGVACYATTYTCPAVLSAPPANNILAGCMYAQSNGFLTAGRQAVTFLSGTGSAPSSGVTSGYWVLARVREQIPQLFSAALGFPTATVIAQSTAAVTVAASACIYVLSPNASPALSVSGSSTVSTTQCGVFINSSASAALTVSGASRVNSTSIRVNGPGSSVSITGSSSTNPAPTLNAGSVSDPLASLVAPSWSGCLMNNYTIGNGATATLNPGVYCGGINITGGATVTLKPGPYILNGGGLTVSNAAKMSGSGVIFYNTGSSGHTIGPITVTGSAVVNLSAPTSGTYQGIAFFQDRTMTYTAHNSISNAGTGNITGTFYFPTTAFDYAGSSAGSVYAAFIASTIFISGSSSLANDSTGVYTGLANYPGAGGAKSVMIQ